MKKIILPAFVVACVVFGTSCSKEVKAPAKTSSSSSARPGSANTVNSQTPGNQNDHTCGSGSGSAAGH